MRAYRSLQLIRVLMEWSLSRELLAGTLAHGGLSICHPRPIQVVVFTFADYAVPNNNAQCTVFASCGGRWVLGEYIEPSSDAAQPRLDLPSCHGTRHRHSFQMTSRVVLCNLSSTSPDSTSLLCSYYNKSRSSLVSSMTINHSVAFTFNFSGTSSLNLAIDIT